MTGGRPLGLLSIAILEYLQTVREEEVEPTAKVIAAACKISRRDTKATLSNLVRAGKVRIVHCKRVHYRNRPVAVYEATHLDQEPANESPFLLQACWGAKADHSRT